MADQKPKNLGQQGGIGENQQGGGQQAPGRNPQRDQSTREKSGGHERKRPQPDMTEAAMPLWEVFIRSRNGLAHHHAGSLHAADATMALQAARF